MMIFACPVSAHEMVIELGYVAGRIEQGSGPDIDGSGVILSTRIVLADYQFLDSSFRYVHYAGGGEWGGGETLSGLVIGDALRLKGGLAYHEQYPGQWGTGIDGHGVGIELDWQVLDGLRLAAGYRDITYSDVEQQQFRARGLIELGEGFVLGFEGVTSKWQPFDAFASEWRDTELRTSFGWGF